MPSGDPGRAVILPARREPVEDALDQPAHQGWREASRRVAAGVLPEQPPGYRQQRPPAVAVPARRIGELVTRLRDRVDDRAVEATIRIREVPDGSVQLL